MRKPRTSRLKGRARNAERRGVALIMVLGAITILAVLMAEFQDEASSEAAAALADRDAVKAEYAARSAVNLARLLLASEPTIRTAIGPLLSLMMGGQAPQIPVWEYADRVLGAFNDPEGNASFQQLANVDLNTGKNLGTKGQRFELVIVDEDAKINFNTAARGDAITEQRMGLQIQGLLAGAQFDPMFENRDAEGQYSDRATICGAVVDWADPDENLYMCDPRNAQNTGSAAEDTYYQQLKVPYFRKNAAYDSLDELHLVRGISDDFFRTFIDPDSSSPKTRPVTVWGQGTVNVNSANAQTLLAVVCGAAVQNPPQPLCTDPLIQAKFLTGINLIRGFTSGAPIFGSPKSFVRAMQGQGMFGQILKGLLQLDPIQFISAADTEKLVSTESKIFSIYADGIVSGYKRKTTVRVHAVVDFRNAPPVPTMMLPGGAGSGSATATATTTSTTPLPAGSAGVGGTGLTGDQITAALQPNAGGQIIYYRVE